MANTELSYIQYCKKLVEEKLKWINSEKWTQRDYLHLIELIESKTGISLSLSTIKRIWKEDLTSIPQPATLDALARFLEYDNWLHFKRSNQKIISNEEAMIGETRWFSDRLIYFVLASIVFLAVFGFFLKSWQSKTAVNKISYNPEQIAFSCKNSAGNTLPNTVVFSYNLDGINADSFFIQQSWNKFRRARIQKDKHNLTSVYYYPGYHHAKLIANDSVIKETLVEVKTANWVALVKDGYMDDIPVYIRNIDIIDKGELHVTKNHLNDNQVTTDNNTLTSYYYVSEFENLSSSNFCFETKVKCDSIYNYSCPGITILILGENDIDGIPLTIPGCVGNSMVKMGDITVDGRNDDLTSFGCNIFEWQKVRLHVKNNSATIYINDKEVLAIPFKTNIGDIVGFNVDFTGTGAIDYVKLYNENNDAVYNADFDAKFDFSFIN